MAAILNFRIFRKIAKHKNAYISKTVLDRAISTKFLTHWVSLQSSHANFQKNFILPKMAAILNFRIFAQKLQNTKMLIFRKPCYIERFRRNFLSSGYLCRAAIPKSFHLVKFQTHSYFAHLLKKSKCELPLKVLQMANFSQITHSPTFGRAFTWWSFRPIANYSPTQNE